MKLIDSRHRVILDDPDEGPSIRDFLVLVIEH